MGSSDEKHQQIRAGLGLSDGISRIITVTSKVFSWFAGNLNFCFPLFFLFFFLALLQNKSLFDRDVSFQVIFLAFVLCFLPQVKKRKK